MEIDVHIASDHMRISEVDLSLRLSLTYFFEIVHIQLNLKWVVPDG